MAAGTAAVVLAGALGAWFSVLAEDGYLARVNAATTVAAVVVLAAALALRTPAAIPFALFALGGEYVAIVGFEADDLDTHAPVVAGALFAVAELAYWSLELRTGVADEAGTYLRRISVLAMLALSSVAVGAILLVVVDTIAAGGVAVDVLGGAAAVGALALVALASRRA